MRMLVWNSNNGGEIWGGDGVVVVFEAGGQGERNGGVAPPVSYEEWLILRRAVVRYMTEIWGKWRNDNDPLYK